MNEFQNCVHESKLSFDTCEVQFQVVISLFTYIWCFLKTHTFSQQGQEILFYPQ